MLNSKTIEARFALMLEATGFKWENKSFNDSGMDGTFLH